VSEPTKHELTADGESTENWALMRPGFMGTVRQLTCCGRCGKPITKRPDEPRHIADVFKPTMHWLCDECFEALPSPTPEVDR
jgi:hypothetical protein